MKSKAVYKPLCLVKKRRLQAKMPQFVVFKSLARRFQKITLRAYGGCAVLSTFCSIR